MDIADLVIKNGVIVDGSGNPWFNGDIAILEDKIVYVGKNHTYRGEVEIDAKGLVVAPGFIDIHNHSDITIFTFPEAENLVLQGITTIVCGNCGFSPAPALNNVDELRRHIEPFLPENASLPWTWGNIKDYYNAVDSVKPALNFVELVGHGTIRINVMGFSGDKAKPHDLDKMTEILRNALVDGAWGLSYGLLYTPGSYADMHELISLAKVVGSYGGFCSIHMRNESYKLIDSVVEALNIAINGNVPLEISHHKASGRDNRGLTTISLSILKHYRMLGIDVTVDVYPYTAGCTSLSALLPPWVHEGGLDAMLDRIRKRNVRERISKDLEGYNDKWESLASVAGWENIILTNLKVNKEYNGKSILEISKIRGQKPIDTILDILIEEDGGGEVILHTMSKEDVYTVIKSDLSMIGTDGWAWSYSVGGGHPRLYATYPRFLRLVRENKLFTLEEAVRKVASMPAWRIGLYDRGLIRPGFYADLVIFNYKEIRDTNSYEEPAKQPKGIKYVIINGKITVEDGTHTLERHGRTLRKVLK